MRTTVNLDTQWLVNARRRAAEQGISLSCIIENALREALSTPGRRERQPTRLITVSGVGLKPGVDLDNNRSLQDIMDEHP
jgi:hypothetical protein